ncbi:hypothetical protein QTP86_032105 [Hemibagrus guttatus]|nr:hypothetical protein QTP86_032105 [Hemibagrus guttatus]
MGSSIQGEHQRRLYKEMLESYNRLERPVANDSAPLVVELGLTLLQIIDVSIRNPKDSVRCYIAIQVLEWLQKSNSECVQRRRGQSDNTFYYTDREVRLPFILVYGDVLKAFGDDPFLFQHDCTPVHKASSIKTWMSEFGVEELDCPAQSPDLNPIEHLWDELERRLRARPSRPISVPDLTNALLEERTRKTQVLITNAWLQLDWTDVYLSWNPENYPGVNNLRFPSSQIWTPDILLYNSADERFDATFHTNVLVNSSGACQYIPPGILKSTCYIDVRWFPFDVQKCDLKFGSWTHNGWLLDLQMREVDISTYIPNGEWDLVGKGRELADMMERRKVDILCVQETRWKGSKARSIGAGFKLFYYGVDSKRNGVGVVLKEEFVRNVLEVKRVSDRVMSLKLEIEGVMLNVVSGYAPQVGCELEEKERFWSELDEVMESIPTGERVVIGADFNGHVGEGNTGDEEVMGKFGVKERNLEGQMVVDFAKRMDMGVVNTYFQKREEHRVTYKSGGRRTQVDYILCRRGNLKEISDCKVVVGESVARQHRMVVCRMTLMVCKTKRSKIEKKTKWWKLKKEECCEEFRQKLRQALGGQVVLPDDWETTAEVIRETGRKVLGVSSGRRKEDKETWWWNEEVQDSVQRKRLAKKKWDMDRTEENRQEYKELQRRVKREVSKAKQKAYEELYTRLDTREGEKDLYRLARQRDRDGKDVQQVRVIKDRDGRVLTSEESVQRRWKEYFEELMNEENEREKRVEGVNSVEQKVDKIRKDEVRKALKRMKSGKAVGPDDIPVEVWKCLGEAAVEFLANLFNRVLESEKTPEEWRRSVLVPIFKNKGDVQSCSNYRGIKLMSHTMKLWERVVEARLRKVVDICEQQYGFMPRKSTTDAIFALRILMEKYRDGQRELHCVFVDLEKAYDRVPREELWYCMRKSGVAEKYVRVMQDMYERSRTVVRCAVGQTEEFKVEVGLHHGSALSPFLFAMVMDQLSEEVRQESPWTMMFADDIVICSESREQVEENLERWRFALERRGMKVSRSKTEYMCVNEREGSGTVRLQGEEVKKVQEFKYLGSTVQSNGECGKEVKKRVQAGWNGWRKVWGVLCDRKISARIKGKVYRTVVRPAMLYGLETVSLRKRQESELEVAELKMLRFSLGVTRLDRIRNEYIRGTAHVGRLGDKVREARLRWFGHVQRRERVPGKRNELYYECCKEPYPDVTYTVTMRRRTLYYGLNLLIPCVLISGLALLVFLLPADSGEKISLGITVLLSLTVFMLLVAEIMPATSDSVPLIGTAYCLSVLCEYDDDRGLVCRRHRPRPAVPPSRSTWRQNAKMVTLHRWLNSGVLVLWGSGQEVRVILLQWCAWFLRMKKPGDERKSAYSYSSASTSSLQMGSVPSQMGTNGHTNLYFGFHSPDSTCCPNSSDSGVSCGVSCSGGHREAASALSGEQRELQRLLVEVSYLAQRFRAQDEAEAVRSEWKFAAAVVDRLCLVAFSLFSIVCTFAILMSAPNFIEAVSKDFT